MGGDGFGQLDCQQGDPALFEEMDVFLDDPGFPPRAVPQMRFKSDTTGSVCIVGSIGDLRLG
jgi:hypothetical protein